MALKLRPLYVLSAACGIAAGFISLGYRANPGEPSDEALAARQGFTSHAEMDRIGKLLDAKQIDDLSPSDASLIKDLLHRKTAARWWAVGAIGNFGPSLQHEFLPDVTPLIGSAPDDPRIRRLLVDWQMRNGRRSLLALAKDQNKAVRNLANEMLQPDSRASQRSTGAGAVKS